METFDLTKDGILIRLHIRQGSQTASSRTLRDEAAEKHNADKRSIRTGVLIIKSEDREEIQGVISAASTVYYKSTLPWEERAFRLLPTKLRDNCKRELATLRDEFNTAVENLIGRYDELKLDYERRLNDPVLYREIPFPSKQDLREGFSFEVREMPIANVNQLYLRHVSAEAMEEIKRSASRELGERLKAAQGDIVARLVKMVQRVIEQTSDEKKKIYDSLIGNIEEAIPVLRSLNLSGDPEVADLIKLVEEKLVSVDANQMRNDFKYRTQVAKDAQEVLDELLYWMEFGSGAQLAGVS